MAQHPSIRNSSPKGRTMHHHEERHLRYNHQSFSYVVFVQSVDGSSFFSGTGPYVRRKHEHGARTGGVVRWLRDVIRCEGLDARSRRTFLDRLDHHVGSMPARSCRKTWHADTAKDKAP